MRSLEWVMSGALRRESPGSAVVPEVRPLFTSAVMDGKTICSAEIPAAGVRERPCFYSSKGRTGGAFIRSGGENLPMPFLEIYS